jgi:hypothetical protein
MLSVKLILKKRSGEMCSELIWLRIGTNGFCEHGDERTCGYNYVGSCATVSVSSKTLFFVLCYETSALLNCVLRGINNMMAVIDITN